MLEQIELITDGIKRGEPGLNGFGMEAGGTEVKVPVLSPSLTPPTDHIIDGLSTPSHKASAWVHILASPSQLPVAQPC